MLPYSSMEHPVWYIISVAVTKDMWDFTHAFKILGMVDSGFPVWKRISENTAKDSAHTAVFYSYKYSPFKKTG